MEQTVKEGAVIQKEIPELFINGENTVAMGDIDEFKGHGGEEECLMRSDLKLL